MLWQSSRYVFQDTWVTVGFEIYAITCFKLILMRCRSEIKECDNEKSQKERERERE